MSTDQKQEVTAPKDRADELSDRLRLVRDALSLDLGDGIDVVDGARKCREDRDRLLNAAKAIIQRGEEEGWIDYNGTDESRLDLLEDAVALVEADGR